MRPRSPDAAIEFTPELIGLYGPPGSGKTGLGTALPWGPKWGNKAVYLVADPRGANLKAVRKENREHLVVVVPEPKEVGGKLVLDMNDEVVAAISYDWKKYDPEIGTLIFDTVSIAADHVLAAVAESSAFSDKHATYGKGAAAVAIPMQGDYGAAQGVVRKWFRFLENSPLNIIAIFHGDVVEADEEHNVAWGGPTTVGKAGIRDMARKFDNLFFCCNRGITTPGNPPKTTMKYEVHTQKRGLWEAKIRLIPNTIPLVDITDNPRLFWESYQKAQENA